MPPLSTSPTPTMHPPLAPKASHSPFIPSLNSEPTNSSPHIPKTSSSPNIISTSPSSDNLSINPNNSGIPSADLSNFAVSGNPSPAQSASKKSKSLYLIIIGGVVIGGIVLGYFYLWPKLFKPKTSVKPVAISSTTTIPPTTITVPTTIPQSPFPQISGPYQKQPFSITIAGPLVASAIKDQVLGNTSPANTFKVLIPKVDGSALSGEEVILSLIPNLPQRLKPYLLGRKYMLYAYYGNVHPSLGLIVNIGNDSKADVQSIFAAWAKGVILNDLKNFFVINIPRKAAKHFQEKTQAGAEIHYFLYQGDEAAISYAFFDKYLIITSSLESVNSAVNHLQGVTEPIIP